MIEEGQTAPDFTLPGIVDDDQRAFRLADTTDGGRLVLLLFYPFDFSPVCTNELCAIRDAAWFEFTENLAVWAASGDSTYAHEAFAREFDLQFPLLSDADGSVAGAYGVRYDEHEGHPNVPKRAVFVIDSERTVRYAWHTDDAFEVPEFAPVKRALDELAATDDDTLDPIQGLPGVGN